jgi:hypothetical protein
VLRVLVLGLAALLVSCESSIALGTACERASDCSAPLVCRFGACRAECRETRDCPLGAECLPDVAGGACALATDRCSIDEDCTAPLVCGADGECRAACLVDDDCTDDGECVLAGRLVCVAREPAAPAACSVEEGPGTFDEGLDHWCVETSAGLGVGVVTIVPTEAFTGDAAMIDLDGAAIGSWARISQEAPFVPAQNWTFYLHDPVVEGGLAVSAIELISHDGSVLGRLGLRVGEGDCEETGRPAVFCADNGAFLSGTFGIGGATTIPYANVDVRQIARVRRVFEVARTGQGALRAGLGHVSAYPPTCLLAWWRDPPHVLALDLDDPRTLPGGATFTPGDAPLRLFDASACGQAVAFDGGATLDVPVAATDGPRTISFFWHGTRMSSPGEGAVLVREIGGDVELAVRAGTLTARAGLCAGSPALELIDDAPLSSRDRRWQEAQLFVDRAAGRLCLARNGTLVRCVTGPACALGPSTATGLRFGEVPSSFGPDEAIGIDEIRVDDADVLPRDSATRSGVCHLDRACFDAVRDGVRDVGSGECVLPSECTSIALCPRDATEPELGHCSTEPVRMPCGWDTRTGGSRCGHGVAYCGTGACPNVYTQCEDLVAADFASCP